MKHVNISYIGFIALFSLAIQLLLFTSSQAFYPLSTLALDKDINDNKSQSSSENTSIVGTTTQNNSLNELFFSDPFYLSNDTLILDKILIDNSSATTNREVQFFVERGFINASLVTYNVGYYVEDPNVSGSSSESNSLRNIHDVVSGENYAKGSGILLTENGDIIKWDAFDQIINKSKYHSFFYAGIIFFSSAADSKNNALSFLTNQVGLYEFSIDSKNATITTTDTDTDNITTTTTAPNTTHRTIWLWPYTY